MDGHKTELSVARLHELLRTGLVIALQKPDKNPKRKKLGDGLLEFFAERGLQYRPTNSSDYGLLEVPGMAQPVLVRLVKNGDAVRLVENGQVDLAFTGADVYCEYYLDTTLQTTQATAVCTLPIPVARCELRVLLPGEHAKVPTGRLAGRQVFSKYGELTRAYLRDQFGPVRFPVQPCAGGVEASVAAHNITRPPGDWAFGIDIVQTGKSAEEAGLTPREIIGTSEAIMIAKAGLLDTNSVAKRALAQELVAHLGPVGEIRQDAPSLFRFVSTGSSMWPRMRQLRAVLLKKSAPGRTPQTAPKLG